MPRYRWRRPQLVSRRQNVRPCLTNALSRGIGATEGVSRCRRTSASRTSFMVWSRCMHHSRNAVRVSAVRRIPI